MGGGQTLAGPDLAAGVSIDEIPDGGSLLGHAGGEGVLLVRQGQSVYAITASCTHYGGPLAEGVVVNGEVHCPWHHARFDFTTGAAVGAPAFNPLGCYDVSRDGNRVRVGSKRPEPAPRPRTVQAPESVLIIGGGPSAMFAAEALRSQGYAGPITLISEEQGPPVDRPNLSKDYLAGNAPEEWIPLRSPEALAANGITLRDRTRAMKIDSAAKKVHLADGSNLSYGALLIATGASPIRLELPGSTLGHVLTLRSHADSRAIIEKAKAAKKAVVIGASFIGLEVAASLRARNVEVTVVAPEALPLGRVLGTELGAFVQKLHEDKGVRFKLGRKPAAITETQVSLDNGEKLDAELVVMGVGVRPNTQLAETAGCKVDRGVLVDATLQTSVPGIYASGDVARWPWENGTTRIEHWVVAERMGAAAAKSILGNGRPYRDVPFFWSQHYDVPINYVGVGEGWESSEVAGIIAERNCLIAYRKGGKIVAMASIYRDRDSLIAEDALGRGDQQTLEKLLAAARAA